MEEYFDIYDGERRNTGRTMARKGYFLHEGEYCLIVLGILERSDHTFLITRRAMDKRWAPGAWEVPGGGVKAGETSEDAVRREVFEETGVDVRTLTGKRVDSYSNVDLARGDNYYVDLYHFFGEIPEEQIRIDAAEATAVRFASPKEIRQYFGDGMFLHYERIRDALLKSDVSDTRFL